MHQRIAVVGTSGSGKSTLARMVARKRQLKHIELDALYHHANWTPNPNFTDDLERMLDSAESWITDGNYKSKGAQAVIWPKLDTLIWLDYSRTLCLWRITKRSLKRSIFRQKLWNSNQESLLNFLSWSDRSLFYWVWKTHGQRHQQYSAIMQDPQWQHLKIIRFQSPKQTQRWLDTI